MVLVVINNFLTCQVLPHLTEIGESSARGEDTDERVLELYYDLAMVLDMLTDYLSFIVKIRDQTRLVTHHYKSTWIRYVYCMEDVFEVRIFEKNIVIHLLIRQGRNLERCVMLARLSKLIK
jgi:hypothetical protein